MSKSHEEVRLTASLYGTSCIKFDGDGGGSIRFAVPASDVAALARLLAMMEQELEITVKLK